MRSKVAIIATHPIQYYSPWFRYLAQQAHIDVRVYYLWNFGVAECMDRGFGVSIRWDIPLLEGYEHIFIENKSPWPGTHHFWGLWNADLVSLVRDYSPDAVLLTAYTYATIIDFLWHWRKDKIPILFRGDSHRLVSRHGFLEWLKRTVITNIFKRFAAVLYVGSANREYFILHGVPAEKLFHAPHAVDNEHFASVRKSAEEEARQWKRSLGIPDEHRVILYAGKFEEKKRPRDLLLAFLNAGFEHTSLLFVGSGQMENSLRVLAAGNPCVYFAPFQNQSLMPRTYAACDVYVLPSFSETWGLGVNEAMCMGRAVIVSDHVGCAGDLVQPRENGLVFRAGDVKALEQCLHDALADTSRLQVWGQRGSEIIKRHSYLQATEGLRRALTSVGVTC